MRNIQNLLLTIFILFMISYAQIGHAASLDDINSSRSDKSSRIQAATTNIGTPFKIVGYYSLGTENLEFRTVSESSVENLADFERMVTSEGDSFWVSKKAIINSSDIEGIQVEKQTLLNGKELYKITVHFKRVSWNKIYEITNHLINKRLAVIRKNVLFAVRFVYQARMDYAILADEIDLKKVDEFKDGFAIKDQPDLDTWNKKSIEWLEQRLKMNPEDVKVIALLAKKYFDNHPRECEKVVALLEQGIPIEKTMFTDPSKEWNAYAILQCYRSLKQYDKALSFLDKSLSINEDKFTESNIRNMKADYYVLKGEKQLAVNELEKSLAIIKELPSIPPINIPKGPFKESASQYQALMKAEFIKGQEELIKKILSGKATTPDGSAGDRNAARVIDINNPDPNLWDQIKMELDERDRSRESMGFFSLGKEILEFRSVAEPTVKIDNSEFELMKTSKGDQFLVCRKADIDANDIYGVLIEKTTYRGNKDYRIAIYFKQTSWDKVHDITSRLLKKRLAIIRGDALLMAPVIQESLTSAAVFMGGFNSTDIEGFVKGFALLDQASLDSWNNKNIEWLEERISKKPTDIEMLSRLSREYLVRTPKQCEKALPILGKVMLLDPSRIVHVHLMHNCYKSLGQYDKALTFYEKTLPIIKVKENELDIRNMMAEMYGLKGDFKKMIDQAEKNLIIMKGIPAPSFDFLPEGTGKERFIEEMSKRREQVIQGQENLIEKMKEQFKHDQEITAPGNPQ